MATPYAEALRKAVQPSLATAAGLRLDYSKAEAAKPSKESAKAVVPAMVEEATTTHQAGSAPVATPYAEALRKAGATDRPDTVDMLRPQCQGWSFGWCAPACISSLSVLFAAAVHWLLVAAVRLLAHPENSAPDSSERALPICRALTDSLENFTLQ